MKKCAKCETLKTFDSFYKCNRAKDGYKSYCKDCSKADTRAWYLKNKEHKNEYDSLYRATHKGQIKETYKKWYEINREKLIKSYNEKRDKNSEMFRLAKQARNKKWYDKNRDSIIKKNVAWRKAHPDKAQQYRKKWADKNPERAILYAHTRRALSTKARGHTTVNQLNNRLSFYAYKCWICGVDYQAIDHVIPLSKGGTNWPANLRPICTSCNSSKHAHPPTEYLKNRVSTRIQ